MADSIKIGNLDISAFKVGGADCSIYLGDVKMYPQSHDYSKDYLTFVALEDGSFSFSGSSTANCLSYSLDSGATWSTPAQKITTSTISSGNTIMWKGSGLTIGSSGIGAFLSSGQFEAEGNIMSLLFGDNFSGQTDLTGYDYAFNSLFKGCTTITSAENLILPATTLSQNCYNNMFYYCTSLTTAPELPATTLASGCYYNMFGGCTSLTTAPVLSATTLANNCYNAMFEGCTSLTTAPVLPATTLASGCYRNMFNGCTSLNSITCLATDKSASMCTNSWVFSVAASGTFTKAASMTNWTTGNNGIPKNWTVVDYSG